MQLDIVTISGEKYSTEIDSFNTKISEVISGLTEKYSLKKESIVLIARGKCMTETDKKLSDYSIDKNIPIILHLRSTEMEEEEAPKTEVTVEVASESDSGSESETESNSDTDSSSEGSSSQEEDEEQPEDETRIYNGEQLKAAIENDPYIILNILQLLAMTNPFILSYIATVPQNVKKMVIDTLDNKDFSLKVIVPKDSVDPIRDALNMNQTEIDRNEADEETTESTVAVTDSVEERGSIAETEIPSVNSTEGPVTINQYDVDKTNIEYILEQVDNEMVNFQYAKDIYLLLNRNIEGAINMLKGKTN